MPNISQVNLPPTAQHAANHTRDGGRRPWRVCSGHFAPINRQSNAVNNKFNVNAIDIFTLESESRREEEEEGTEGGGWWRRVCEQIKMKLLFYDSIYLPTENEIARIAFAWESVILIECVTRNLHWNYLIFERPLKYTRAPNMIRFENSLFFIFCRAYSVFRIPCAWSECFSNSRYYMFYGWMQNDDNK